jgi:hypothetical protein
VDLILLHVGVIVDLLETNCRINTCLAIRPQLKKSEKDFNAAVFQIKCA